MYWNGVTSLGRVLFTSKELAGEMLVCLSNVLPWEKNFFEFQLVREGGMSI